MCWRPRCASCQKAPAPPGGAGAPPAPTVTVSQPESKEVTEWDEYQGRLDAVATVEIRARVTGYLDSVHFTDGAEVKQGDLLFMIDPRPYRADLDRAEAELLQAQTRFELQSAAATVEMSKLNLDYTRVTAPISGRIGRKLITEGNLVNGSQGQSTLLATIVALDPIYCYFDADERSVLKYRGLAREGKEESLEGGRLPCELELADEKGFPHGGTLNFVDNRVDSGTGTLRVRGVFANPARILEPGYFARVRVPGSAPYRALLVPDAAVGADQGVKFVYVVDASNHAQIAPVQLGPLMDGLRVVREGLHSNDWVVVNGLMSIRPGAAVNPSRSGAAQEAAAR